MHRVLDHYLHTAMAAAQRFSPHRPPLRLAPALPGVLPADAADKEQAIAWFDAEVPVLLALIAFADANGFDTHAWQIPWALGPFFNRRGRWQDYVGNPADRAGRGRAPGRHARPGAYALPAR